MPEVFNSPCCVVAVGGKNYHPYLARLSNGKPALGSEE